jgi:hypothetical protein
MCQRTVLADIPRALAACCCVVIHPNSEVNLRGSCRVVSAGNLGRLPCLLELRGGSPGSPDSSGGSEITVGRALPHRPPLGVPRLPAGADELAALGEPVVPLAHSAAQKSNAANTADATNTAAAR